MTEVRLITINKERDSTKMYPSRAVSMPIRWEISAGTYNVRARSRHIKEKLNALNISKAVSHNALRNKIHLLSVAVIRLVRNGRS